MMIATLKQKTFNFSLKQHQVFFDKKAILR